MFKKSLLAVTAVVVFIALYPGSGHSASLVKVGVIDLQKALNATSEGLAAKETLKKKHEAKQQKVDSMKDELQTLEEKIKSPVISEKAQSELKDQYRKKQAELIEFVTQAKEEEERENQVLSARILDGLIDIAREIAVKEKYTIILERTGGAVLYFEEGLDLTEQAVKIYNERFQAEKNQ